MEAVVNTSIGFVLSMVVWHFVALAYGIPMPLMKNLQITGIFTFFSISRSYVLRRLFNGRSVWQAIRGLHPVTASPFEEGRLIKGQ